MSPVMEEKDEVVIIPQMSQSVPAGRIQERILDEFVDASIPLVMEEVLKIVKRIPEQSQHRTVEQIVDMTAPQEFTR